MILDSVFSVKPRGFWVDKILERECKRPVVASIEPRLLIEKTVSFYLFIFIYSLTFC